MRSRPQSSCLHVQALENQMTALQADIAGTNKDSAHYGKGISKTEDLLVSINQTLVRVQRLKQKAATALEHLRQTLSSNLNALSAYQAEESNHCSFKVNCYSHCVKGWERKQRRFIRYIPSARLRMTHLRRRLEVIAWREEVLSTLFDPTGTTYLFLPPVVCCCTGEGRDKPVCKCHIRVAFWQLSCLVAS